MTCIATRRLEGTGCGRCAERPQPSSLFESNVRYRLTVASEEKQALARAALLQIEPGQAVLIDESTTGLALARLLPARVPLTVITNSLSVMQELRSVRTSS